MENKNKNNIEKDLLSEWENITFTKEEKNTKNKINNCNKNNESKKMTISEEFLLENDWENTNEQIYKQKILEEPWIKNNEYLDINIFQLNIPSFHYFDKHCDTLYSYLPEKEFNNIISLPNNSSQVTIKKLINKGIHPKYMHDILLKLYDIKNIQKNHYKNIYSIIFKNYDPKYLDDYVPYFCGHNKKLKDILPFHYLNEKGIQELKILLWMINDNNKNIIFCPILIKLISLILIFCNKYETFEIICKLIEEEKNINKDDEYKLNWKLKFCYEDNKKLIYSISQCLKESSTKNIKIYNSKFEKIKYNIEKIYEDMCFNFFINYFNFYGIIRFLQIFLSEGVKCFYRLIYAFETEICEKSLHAKNKEEIIHKIREKCNKINDIQELFNISYKLKLIKYYDNYEPQNKEDILLYNKKGEFYLPIVKGGNLLNEYEIIHLWEILPFEYKIKNASLIYQASKDGYNLPNLIGMEEKYNKNTIILFLIETEKGDKFGFISSNLIIHTDNKYQRPSASFLFTIKPKFELFTPIDSDEILYVTTKDFIFGNGSNGPAIQLNQDLKEGDSYSGGCFNNPCLVNDPNGHFSVEKLEIFKLE